VEAALEAAEPRKGPRSLNPAVNKAFHQPVARLEHLDPPLDPCGTHPTMKTLGLLLLCLAVCQARKGECPE